MKNKNIKKILFFFLSVFFIACTMPKNAYCAKISETKKSTIEWVAEDQVKAGKRAAEIVPFVDEVLDECRLSRQQKLRDMGLSVKDIETSYFLLDSPIINKEENQYGPVRFMHSKHAVSVGDCSACHHYRPAEKNALETTRCSACHQESFLPDHPERIGLKAAYHLQCMGCHQKAAEGPVDCIGCHGKKVPDHADLVKLDKNPGPIEVTKECLRCHANAGEDMLSSVHWLWEGPSSYTLCKERKINHGKRSTALNNY